jgi:hypothetical protein
MTRFLVGHLSPKEVIWDAASAPSATIEPEPAADPRPLKSSTGESAFDAIRSRALTVTDVAAAGSDRCGDGLKS